MATSATTNPAQPPLFPRSFQEWKHLFARSYADWNEDQAPRLGAALAYYTVLSLAPLLILLIALAGLIFGEEAARGQLFNEIQGMVGSDGAKAIQDMIQNASKPGGGIVATLFGLITLIIGASSVASELRASLNTVWNKPYDADAGIKDMVKERSYALVVVLGCGFLLVVSLAASSVIAGAGKATLRILPLPEMVLHVLNIVLSMVVISGVFAALFKYLPDVRVTWRQVFPGAVLTALLFTIGKFAIGMYLGKASFGSTYGAAGSLVIVLVWVYYSAQILFFGAEFTQVYACEHGAKSICPADQPSDKTTVALPSSGVTKRNPKASEKPTAAALARNAAAGNTGMLPVEPGPAGKAITWTGTLLGVAVAGTKIFKFLRK